MALFTRYKSTDLADPVHTLLNRAPLELEAELEAANAAIFGLNVNADMLNVTRTATIDRIESRVSFSGNSWVERRGNTVAFTLGVTLNVAGLIDSGAYFLIGQIMPTQFRPTQTRYLTSRAASAGFAPAEIRPNGEVYLRKFSNSPQPSAVTLEFSDTYLGAGNIV
ncbi:hypothetical protein JOF28_001970 [Leucobacter exalbidus]|uniref:Uncharacterized protein n=1 Tax=Leucobacter exalbidus TaxID=662960 RepID=A0A940PP38_9MICO|nr:hypothetical protein [Leucobacter exalbidus]MBP1326738.1 hypothetical protein [Leucobacter exalbidus]